MKIYVDGIVREATQEEIESINESEKIDNSVLIEQLKQAYGESNNKVIENMECQSLGIETPYNANELYKERQALRDKINELESQ